MSQGLTSGKTYRRKKGSVLQVPRFLESLEIKKKEGKRGKEGRKKGKRWRGGEGRNKEGKKTMVRPNKEMNLSLL